MVISLSCPPYEVVLTNVPLKQFQIHRRIRFTSTATAGDTTTTVVPIGPNSETIKQHMCIPMFCQPNC
jgi:hypothetical protein